MDIKKGDSFEIDGENYYCAELASHYWYCFALPINKPGAPRWFTRDEMAQAKKI